MGRESRELTGALYWDSCCKRHVSTLRLEANECGTLRASGSVGGTRFIRCPYPGHHLRLQLSIPALSPTLMSESLSSKRRVALLLSTSLMLTSQEKSLSRVDRFRTQASSGDRKKTREAFKAAVVRVEGEARWDDKAKLVKEKADWCRRFGEAMVRVQRPLPVLSS